MAPTTSHHIKKTSAVVVSGVRSARARVGVMATFQVSPPDESDFGRHESWPQLFQRFERFRAASDHWRF